MSCSTKLKVDFIPTLPEFCAKKISKKPSIKDSCCFDLKIKRSICIFTLKRGDYSKQCTIKTTVNSSIVH